MGDLFLVRLLVIFAVAFSLSALPGPMSSNFSLPNVNATTLATPEKWYPSGPQFDYWRPTIFLSEATELVSLQSASSPIDITDFPQPFVGVCGQTAFFCTAKQNDTGYVELEFNLAANFWGVHFNFGNPNPPPSTANPGLDIRQGISYLINKTDFVKFQPSVNTLGTAIDDPVPFGSRFQGHSYTTPNPCGWDARITLTGPPCEVGAPGGTAYNCKIFIVSTPCPQGTLISGTSYPWQPPIGSANFCAAATHFQNAFNAIIPGGGVTLNPNCVLIPPTSTVPDPTGNVWKTVVGTEWSPVNLFARIDNSPRLDLGRSIAQEICALFTGVLSFTFGGCTQSATTAVILSESEGPVNAFPGFILTDLSHLIVQWQIYTAAFSGVFPFERGLYDTYNSQFVDSYCTTFATGCPRGAGGTPNPNQPLAQSNGGKCANAAVPSHAPSNYMYVCVPAYDTASSQTKFASCIAVSGDVDTQIGLPSPTLQSCPLGLGPTALSAAYVASDTFGKNSLTIPIYTLQTQFGYLNNWQRVVNHQDGGFEASWAEFNAWSPNPASLSETSPTLTVRQGFSQTTRSLNPYVARTVQELLVLGSHAGPGIYDTLFQENPANPGQGIEWMTNNPGGPAIIYCVIGSVSTCSGASNPASNPIPPFTASVIRMDLRSDLFWQDANLHPTSGFVSAFDVKFTYTTMLANGAFQSTSLAPMQCTQPNCVDGIEVTGPRELEIRLSQSPDRPPDLFILPGLGAITILPGRLWSTCGAATWDAGVVTNSLPDSCMVLDPAKATPQFDPLAAGILIGSGAWECANLNNFTPAGFNSPPAIGTGCARDSSGAAFNAQNPPAGGTFILQRFGYGTGAPGAALPNRIYFRAASRTAQWIWSGMTGNPLRDSQILGIVLRCQNAPLDPLSSTVPWNPDSNVPFPATGGCDHWQQGIGAPGGHSLVGPFQIATVRLVFQYYWTPTLDVNLIGSDWTVTSGTAPDGIASFPPLLYEGSFVQAGVTYNNVLQPATVAASHCTTIYNPTASPVTSGGYDC